MKDNTKLDDTCLLMVLGAAAITMILGIIITLLRGEPLII